MSHAATSGPMTAPVFSATRYSENVMTSRSSATRSASIADAAGR